MMQWVLFLGLKWPKGEADHSFTTTTELENARNCAATPPYSFIAHLYPKLNETINRVLHCISNECPMILVVKCYTA
jgi:hypothetical protein